MFNYNILNIYCIKIRQTIHFTTKGYLSGHSCTHSRRTIINFSRPASALCIGLLVSDTDFSKHMARMKIKTILGDSKSFW